MDENKVYLVWKDVNTGKKFKVGMLYKEDDMFYFRYVLENLKEAEEHGFHLLIPFPNFNAIYFCPHLFANFASRLPDKSRPEIDKILKEYGMTEYDEFELLKRSGAKLPTDGYGFVSMKSIDFDSIEMKHNKLISEAKKYMSTIKDYEHDINHMYDVVNYTKELLNSIILDADAEVCIITAYWHDVGRTKINEGHEKLSAQMLKEEMINNGYDNQFISKCCLAIENHKWNMKPTTTEGLIIKDADKLAWIGIGRWQSCLKNNQNLDSIIKLLPKLRNEILYFNESKKIYDRDTIKLVELLYNDNLRKEE